MGQIWIGMQRLIGKPHINLTFSFENFMKLGKTNDNYSGIKGIIIKLIEYLKFIIFTPETS